MRPPIIVSEGHDLRFFLSTRNVEFGIETQDVSIPDREAYDSEGHLLRLEVGEVKRDRHFLWFRWTDVRTGVRVTEVDPVVDMSAELRNKLVHYLVHGGYESSGLEGRTTAELIGLGMKRMPKRPGGSRDWRNE